MEIKLNNFETIKNLRQNTIFQIKIRISVEKYSFSIGKQHFSMEILIFKKCVFFVKKIKNLQF